MRLSEFLKPDFVVPRLQATGVRGVIDEVAARAQEVGVGSADLISDKLYDYAEQEKALV